MAMIEAPVVEDPEWTSLFEPGQGEVEELTALLGRLPVFDNLTNRELRRVERIVHRRRFAMNEVVIQAWVPRSGLFVVETGKVNVVRQLSSGDSVVVGSLGTGELLGEFAILDDSPRSTSIVAAEPSDMIGFFRPDLMDLVETVPLLGFKILYRVSQIMSTRLNEAVEGLRRVRASLAPPEEED
jgi:CRP-like cAMP-binding protein